VKKIQIAAGAHAKHAEISDGCIDLMLIPKADRGDLMSAMLSFETGEFATQKCVRYEKVLAFELEPDLTASNQAPLAIDGERLVARKITVENHNAFIDVFYDFGD